MAADNAEKVVIFTFDNERFKASPHLNKASGMLKDLLTVASGDENEVEVPIKHDVTKDDLELLNKFIEACHEKCGEDLVTHADDLSHWMSTIPQNKEDFMPIVDGIDKDTLIRSANLGDYLMVYPFLSFCTYALSERCQDLNLAQMREYLNEVNDFDENQQRIINECPEFQNL